MKMKLLAWVTLVLFVTLSHGAYGAENIADGANCAGGSAEKPVTIDLSLAALN